MHSDSRRLIAAVSMAIGHVLDIDDPEDSQMIQMGCYILNSWGFGSEYSYPLYVRGPFSRELDDDYEELPAHFF